MIAPRLMNLYGSAQTVGNDPDPVSLSTFVPLTVIKTALTRPWVHLLIW
jgi:hypothetical protein